MKKTYLYLQPEYVSKFKCDGQSCEAHCCRGWRISIDKKTYKKYANIKPKFEAEKITQHILKAKIMDMSFSSTNMKIARCLRKIIGAVSKENMEKIIYQILVRRIRA